MSRNFREQTRFWKNKFRRNYVNDTLEQLVETIQHYKNAQRDVGIYYDWVEVLDKYGLPVAHDKD